MSRRKNKRRQGWKRQLELNRVVVRFAGPGERRDEISPGRLVAWAEWRGGSEKAGQIY